MDVHRIRLADEVPTFAHVVALGEERTADIAVVGVCVTHNHDGFVTDVVHGNLLMICESIHPTLVVKD